MVLTIRAAAAVAIGLVAGACGEVEAPLLGGPQATATASALHMGFFPEVGKGVNLAETRTYGKCILFKAASSESGTFGQRTFDTFRVKSRTELNGKMNISSSVAAKGLWGSVSAGYSYFQDVHWNATTSTG